MLINDQSNKKSVETGYQENKESKILLTQCVIVKKTKCENLKNVAMNSATKTNGTLIDHKSCLDKSSNFL